MKINRLKAKWLLIAASVILVDAGVFSCGKPEPSVTILEEQNASVREAEADAQASAGEAEASGGEEAEQETVCVFVCGQVAREGVYEFPLGTRVYEAIEAAGGFLPDADTSYVNQALVLTDGEKLWIPDLSESAALSSAEMQEGTAGGKVDLNTADSDLLQTLPGIGPAKAEAILEYRARSGGFESAEELMQVSGIGQASFDKLKDSVIVR